MVVITPLSLLSGLFSGCALQKNRAAEIKKFPEDLSIILSFDEKNTLASLFMIHYQISINKKYFKNYRQRRHDTLFL